MLAIRPFKSWRSSRFREGEIRMMAFNTIHKRGSIPIDSVRAAELEAAFGQLVERAKVPVEDAAPLPEWRRF